MSDKVNYTILCNLVEKYGGGSKKISSSDKTKIWGKIALDYNQETGATKTGKQLQGSWNSRQTRLRTMQSGYKAATKKTGKAVNYMLSCNPNY